MLLYNIYVHQIGSHYYNIEVIDELEQHSLENSYDEYFVSLAGDVNAHTNVGHQINRDL